MAAQRAVGTGHEPAPRVRVGEEPGEYLIQLDISKFAQDELTVEAIGQRVTVRGDQLAREEDDGEPFRLYQRLEESFRLPDDADADRITALYKHRTLEIHARRRPLKPHLVPIEREYLVNPTPKGC
jgi:HSP20 family molecular chaperone IbpA